MKKLRVTVDGKAYDVVVEILDEAGAPDPIRPAHVEPAHVSAPPVSAPAPSGAAAPGDVPSPLAGKVVSIDVKPGQEVAAGAQLLTLEAMKWFWNQYLPDTARRKEPTASPLKASLEELKNLPPALVINGEFDVLRDEAEEYAKRLEAAGVPVKLMRCNGMVHGFLSMLGLVKRAEIYFDEVIGEMKRMVSA